MKPLCFVLDSAADIPTPKAILSGEWRCERVNKVEHFQRIYLDSLDWRLLKNDLSVFADRRGDEVRLYLFDLRDNQLILQVPIKQLPAFAGDLPEGEVAAMLSPILQQRALLPSSNEHLRLEDIITFYSTPDVDTALSILKKYDVSYIIFGQLERGTYDGPGLDKFSAEDGILWRQIYPAPGLDTQNETVIYEVIQP